MYLSICQGDLILPYDKNDAIKCYEYAIKKLTDDKGQPHANSSYQLMELAESKAKQIDPSYVRPKKTSSGGCYVATAVYGSYDCPQVWTLRRYRDYTLSETWYGRAFIHTYYAVSPTLVKWFGETEWFKNMWKPKLDRMVKELNEKGVADTPYQDRHW